MDSYSTLFPEDVGDAYRVMVIGAIERSLIKRFEELLGRVPSNAEVSTHSMQITQPDGVSVYYWVYGEFDNEEDCPHSKMQVPTLEGVKWVDCAPVVRFLPAGFTGIGKWRDAVIEEIEVRRVPQS